MIVFVGMGGLGKIIFVKMVYNDFRFEGIFDLKLWVCVFDNFDIFRVIKFIFEFIIGEEYFSFLDLCFFYYELSDKLREKKIFIVLGDV